MNEHPISNLMTETMSKIKEMVDVNTIIGTPITTADGTTVIPVSKVTFGFASGGSDFAPKHMPQNAPLAFGGGGGAGVTVSPVCFLIIGRDGSANILGVNAQGLDHGRPSGRDDPGCDQQGFQLYGGLQGKGRACRPCRPRKPTNNAAFPRKTTHTNAE